MIQAVSSSVDSSNGEASCCRLCGAVLSQTFVDLGVSPLCETFLEVSDLDRMEPFYPLKAMVCGVCHLVQLPAYVTPDEIFCHYAYFSSYSTSWIAHAKAYCDAMVARFGLSGRNLVVELASNDGYLLQHFTPHGVTILGIEPAKNVAAVAIANGIPTVIDFFGVPLAGELRRQHKLADLIVANNVLAQVPDLNGIAMLLAPGGVVTVEVPHIARLIEDAQFDTVYHEHFSYFSLHTIITLARRHGLSVFDVEQLPTHGGSLRVYLQHAGGPHLATTAVQDVLADEHRDRLDTITGYGGFQPGVERIKRDLLALLIDAKRRGKTVVGYGAPGKGNTLLNYCGIGPDLLEFTVDRNPFKHGRFTPGRRIPILPVEALDAARPDIVLILPWNLKDEIVAQMRHIKDWGGVFAVPIPSVTIIDPGQRAP
jgi:hypothetical protein